MSETTDAMNLALNALTFYQVGMNDFDCHKAVENDKAAIIALNKALKREEELMLGRVYLVATGIVHDGQETYTRHEVCPPLCDSEKLYTRPPQPSGEREANVGLLRMCVEHLRATGRLIDDEGEVTNQIEQAADMLDADYAEK